MRGGTKKEKEKEEEEEEKIPHMCESIGHRPLWSRCPKRGPTDRRTDIAGRRVASHVTKN